MAQNSKNVFKLNTFLFLSRQDSSGFWQNQNFFSDYKACTSIWNLFWYCES